VALSPTAAFNVARMPSVDAINSKLEVAYHEADRPIEEVVRLLRLT
jgi:hypothetical protein